METPNFYNSEDFQSNSIHSEICSGNDCEFVYRKAYKGDWGHWDDLPETTNTDSNCIEIDQQ